MGIVAIAKEYRVSVGDAEIVRIDYTDHLDTAEVITGSPTVSEVGSTALTLGTVYASTSSLTIGGRTVSAGKAVSFSVQGFVSGTTHYVTSRVVTDASPARTIHRQIKIVCV